MHATELLQFRADLTETILVNDRVCGIHFHSGKAAYLWDRFRPDWIPTLHLGHGKLKESYETKEKHHQRAQRITERRKWERQREEQEAMERKAVKGDEPGERIKDIYMVNKEEPFGETGEEEKVEEPNIENNASMQTNPEDYSRSCSTQTEECGYMFRIQKPWLPQKSDVFEEDYFEGDNKKVCYYTGLPSLETLKKTFSSVSSRVTRRSILLSKFQEFVLVLIKLRLGVRHQDLAYAFNVSRTVVSRIII